MSLRRLVMVLVALAPVFGLAASANAGDGNAKGWKKVHVVFTPGGPGISFVDSFCNPDNPALCIGLFKFPDVTQSGDLTGKTVQGDVYATTADGMYVFAASGSFQGTVKGCGIGTFAYTGRALLDAQLDGNVTYTLVPGTGTGELEGITGKVEALPDGLVGVLRCRRH